MKSFVFLRLTGSAFNWLFARLPAVVALGAAASLMLGWQKTALGQSDDFNDGNDAGWVHLDLGTGTGGFYPGANYSFPGDNFGGTSYQIAAPAPPDEQLGEGPARAFSYRTNVYDNFYLAADVVTFDNSLDQAFGFLVRADPGNIGLGTTTGYVLNYDPNQQSGGRGQLQINVVTDEQPTTLVAANITLVPTHRYRFVMNGAASTLIGQIYDFTDLTAPLVTISVNDTTYPGGVLGLFSFSRVDAADYTNSVTGKTDVTFDNYYASTNGPILVDFQRTPHPVPNMPQVANRTPATRANFYAYTNGLSFTATTLTTNAINSSAIRLFLNGANVSSTLAMSGPSNNVDVAFNGLMPNTVYDARIELSDFSGRATTNEFSFDTFDESYLDSPGVKVIEAEDYNYGGGQFQDDPPVSGLDSVGAPVNGSGVGYYDLIGTGGVDFFDFSTAPGSGAAADYRTQDPVGTQAGSATEIDNAGVINDTIRAKYASQDLSEYEVRGTEGGEWLNFTRVFTNATYNVYLREACRAPQTVYLDKVTGDATQTNQTTVRIGAFNVPSTAMLINYSYTPLVDTNGNLAAINLSGTNTLRLTFGGPQTDATKYTMVLNYLVFAPVVTAQIIVESSADVGGTFTTDNTAGVDTATRTITAPLNGSIRFYRIRSGAPPALTITNVRIAGANVVMNYQ